MTTPSDTYGLDGFLGADVTSMPEVFRVRYAEWRDIALQTNRAAVAAQHAIGVHVEVEAEWLGSVYFTRTLASIQAAIVLLERGMVAQSRVVLRCALKTFFALAAIATRPMTALKLIEGHKAFQRQAARNVSLWKGKDLRDAVQRSVDPVVLAALARWP